MQPRTVRFGGGRGMGRVGGWVRERDASSAWPRRGAYRSHHLKLDFQDFRLDQLSQELTHEEPPKIPS